MVRPANAGRFRSRFRYPRISAFVRRDAECTSQILSKPIGSRSSAKRVFHVIESIARQAALIYIVRTIDHDRSRFVSSDAVPAQRLESHQCVPGIRVASITSAFDIAIVRPRKTDMHHDPGPFGPRTAGLMPARRFSRVKEQCRQALGVL